MGVVAPSMEEEGLLRALVSVYSIVQRTRIQYESLSRSLSARVVCEAGHVVVAPSDRSAFKGVCLIRNCGAKARIVESEVPEVVERMLGKALEEEKGVTSMIREVVSRQPLWYNYLALIKGVGHVSAAVLLGYLNPVKFETPSKMWKYSCLHVVDGKAVRRVRGVKLDCRTDLKTHMWKLGMAFAMRGGVYKGVYRMLLAESLDNPRHKDWTMAHHITHARRVTVKLFLSHYHEAVRTMLGLKAPVPYPVLKERHRYIPPLIDYPGDPEDHPFYANVVSRILEKYEPEQLYIKDYAELVDHLRKLAAKKA